MSVRLHAATDRLAARIQSLAAERSEDREAGMVSSEYVMGTAVAAGCAGVLYKVVTSQPILQLFKDFIVHHFFKL